MFASLILRCLSSILYVSAPHKSDHSQVQSPMQAIHDYESAHGIPHNWVNFAISRSSRRADGAWKRAERGEIPLDTTFFAAFHRDLHDYSVWREFCSQHAPRGAKMNGNSQSKRGGRDTSNSALSQTSPIPPVPQMDTTTLFWAMMIISRTADPVMARAIAHLRQSRQFIIAALSNTIAFPDWHPFHSVASDDVRVQFDVFVSSAHVGVRKPDPEAYQVTLLEISRWSKEHGGGEIRMDEVCFLDDIGTNLSTARKLGMHTIKVELGKTAEAVKELEAVVGLDLSGDGKSKL